MLDPFWGAFARDADSRESYRTYRGQGASLFELVGLDEADVAVLPYDWSYATWRDADFYPQSRDRAVAFAREAARAGKRVMVFYETDLRMDIPFENVLFCTDLERSTRRPHEFALPGWSEDLLAKYRDGQVLIRSKKGRPVVGFCGYAPPLGMPVGRAKAKETVRYFLSRTSIARSIHENRRASLRARALTSPGPAARVRALKALDGSSDVTPRFLIRPFKSNARGGRWKQPPIGQDVRRSTQLEFLANMLESDYALCSRGFGNFSYRLYEGLACGRIPVLVDTDCVLPFDFAIDWDSFILRVPGTEVDRIGSYIADFHDSLSAEEFAERQVSCRKLWTEWLSPEGFFANFHRHLDWLEQSSSTKEFEGE